MALLYKRCPNCGSRNIAIIIYGKPSYELIEEAEQGKVKLGGCIIEDGCPEYSCRDCDHEWNKQQLIDNEYNKILSIQVSIGGFFGPNYYVSLNLKNNQIIYNSREDGIQESITKTIYKDDRMPIIEQLKLTNLLGWKAKYIKPYVCDGTQWSVHIETVEKTIHKYGSNKYPREWKMLCKLIEERTGRNFR